MSTDAVSVKIIILINRMANIVDPDETARNEPSHLDLHCLHRNLIWSVRLKGLKNMRITKTKVGLHTPP